MALVRVVLIAAAVFSLTQNTLATDAIAQKRFMRIHGHANPPFGFVQFCRSFAEECHAQTPQHERFTATPHRLIELDEINRSVNVAVAPATDRDIYGVEEYWTFPRLKGDCEDYVVLKRKLLMKRGWPASALLITVVLDENGDGHAVLTARTVHGDFVLDNKYQEVRLWSQTPYRFVMRQSYLNPKIWMSLDPRATVARVASAKVASARPRSR
ncbi:MAG: transglutaminase-like cysteine peptidase [Hyphomicrobiaceae bacterium]